MTWSWSDFGEGAFDTLPFVSGSHMTDVAFTGRTDYMPGKRGNPWSSGFEADYFAGWVFAQSMQGMGFFALHTLQWGLERELFKRVWPVYVLYESGRLTYDAAVTIEAQHPGNQMVVPSLMNMWSQAGNFSGGAMYSIPGLESKFGGEFPEQKLFLNVNPDYPTHRSISAAMAAQGY